MRYIPQDARVQIGKYARELAPPKPRVRIFPETKLPTAARRPRD